MTRCMLRYRVYVGDKPQTRSVIGDPLHVEASRVRVGSDAPQGVDFWAEGSYEDVGTPRKFQAFGTGEPVPGGARWWGTTGRTPNGDVWHLYEVPGDEVPGDEGQA